MAWDSTLKVVRRQFNTIFIFHGEMAPPHSYLLNSNYHSIMLQYNVQNSMENIAFVLDLFQLSLAYMAGFLQCDR